MDDAGVQVQIVSQGGGLNADRLPPSDAIELCRLSNDTVAQRIGSYRDRLFASVAITYRDPEGSADEVKRRADEGFRAVMMYANGEMATRPESQPIFAAAHDKKLPIFLHGGGAGTTRPAGVDLLEDEGRGVMSSSGADAPVANCVMQMIASSLFDDFPDLRVVIRSGGGGVPLLQAKMWHTHHGPSGDRQYRDIFREHFFVDTANVDARTITALHFLMGDDGIVFGSDYGGGSGPMRDAVANVDAQPNPALLQSVTERNSKALLGI